MSFLKVGLSDWAVLHLERARAYNRTDEDGILFVLAQIYTFSGQKEPAQECFRELITVYPNSPYTQRLKKDAKIDGHFALNAGLSSIYHTNSYSLVPIDSNRILTEKGWIHEVNSSLRWGSGSNALVISGLHENALITGVKSYTMGSFLLERTFSRTTAQFGIQGSLSQTDLEAANLAINAKWTPRGKLEFSGGWTWQVEPTPEPAYDHWGFLGVSAKVLEKTESSLSISTDVSGSRSPVTISNSRMGMVYVSGVVQGQNTQTGFFADPEYTNPVSPEAVGLTANPYWNYWDIPRTYFDANDASRWLPLHFETPAGYARARFEISASLRLMRRISLSLTPSAFVQYYPEAQRWFAPPVMTSDLGMDREPYLSNGYWWSAYHPWMTRYFVLYRNREDGQTYYRDYDSNGRYYRVNVEQISMIRMDQGASIAANVTFDITSRLGAGLEYDFTMRVSNLPDDAPLQPEFQDHSIQLRLGYSVGP